MLDIEFKCQGIDVSNCEKKTKTNINNKIYIIYAHIDGHEQDLVSKKEMVLDL